MYEYKCIIKKVVDGDTIDVDIDLGFDVWLVDKRIRLVGIDAPETRTRDLDEKMRGLECKHYVVDMLPINSPQILMTKYYEGKYGRILGDFKLDSSTLTEELLRLGLAEIYE